jgi:rubrerythrin
MKAKNRLHNMEVEEISLVTRPANKQKFLIVKDEDGEAAFEMVPRDAGGCTLVAKDEGVPADAVPVSGDVKYKLTKDIKAALIESTATALEKMTEFAKALDAAEEVDKGEVPNNLRDSVKAISTATLAIAEKAGKKPEEEEEDKGKGKDDEMKKVHMCPGCGYEGVPGRDGVCPKCGKPMEMKEEKQGQKPPKKPCDEEETPLKQLKKLGDDIQKMLPRGIEPSTREDTNAGAGHIPEGSGVPLMSAEQFFANVNGLSEVMKTNASLVAKNEELKTKIVELEKQTSKRVSKSVGQPNSGPVDSGSGSGFGGWPLDMNE